MRLLWLWEKEKGKYYGQILKWLQAGSSAAALRTPVPGLHASPLGKGGVHERGWWAQVLRGPLPLQQPD